MSKGRKGTRAAPWRWVRVAALAAVVLAGAGMVLPTAWIGMGDIPPERLAERLARNDPGVLVVDVRTAFEFRHGHIRGAVPIPLHALPFRLGALAGQRDKELVVICLSGHRSRLAGMILELAGHARVTNLDGGMAAWRAHGLPEVRSRPAPV